MRTLFAKFLLWFWLGLVALLGAEIVLESNSLEEGFRAFTPATSGPLVQYTHLAKAVLASRGVAGLDSLIDIYRRESQRAFDVYRVTADAREGLPHGAVRAGTLAVRTGRGSLIEARDGLFIAYPIGSADGREFALVVHPLSTSRERAGAGSDERDMIPFVPTDLGVRLLVALAIGSAACYLLARYITAPVARLRKATRRIAEGDFTARTGSTQRRRRDELEDLGRDFDRMAERLDSLVGAQRRLLADVSHELRSPLARMKVAVALLRQRQAEDPDGMIARLELESDRLNQLIGDVLTLSRGEAGEPVPDSVRVDLGDLAHGIASDALFEAGGRVSDVRVTCPEPVVVMGVPGLLSSALDNVVRNATRHTRAGTAVEIEVARHDEGGAPEAVVTVRDHGPGLPHDQLEKIFEPFYRFEGGPAPTPGGTGLGLTIAKRILSRHGGSIRADAAPGEGLVVTICLPAALSADGS